jgi:hypothetical protein
MHSHAAYTNRQIHTHHHHHALTGKQPACTCYNGAAARLAEFDLGELEVKGSEEGAAAKS